MSLSIYPTDHTASLTGDYEIVEHFDMADVPQVPLKMDLREGQYLSYATFDIALSGYISAVLDDAILVDNIPMVEAPVLIRIRRFNRLRSQARLLGASGFYVA